MGAEVAVLVGDESSIFDKYQLPVMNLEDFEAHLTDDRLKNAVGVVTCMFLLQ